MNKQVKYIGGLLLGACVFVAAITILMLFLKGAVWLSERAYPWLMTLTSITFLIFVVVLLPLAIFPRTRSGAGGWILLTSHIFGLTLWVWSLLTSYSLWGVLGIVIGILLAGVGVVPIAILATLLNGMWSMAGQLLFVTAITLGTKFLGGWAISHSNYERN